MKQRKPFLSSSSSRLVVKNQSAGCGLLRILLLRLFVLARAEGNVELFWDLHCRAFWSLITVTLSCSGFWPLLQPYTDVLPGALPLGDAGVCEHRADPATSQVVSWHQGWEVHGYLSFPACANPVVNFSLGRRCWGVPAFQRSCTFSSQGSPVLCSYIRNTACGFNWEVLMWFACGN